MTRKRRCGGQAAVEFLALLPAVGLLVLVVIQAMMLAGAWMSASSAARAAARAAEVGAPADEAARSALPDGLARGARITRDDTTITVSVRAPVVVPGVDGFRLEATGRR